MESFPSKTKQILFASLASGEPTTENFKLAEKDLPKDLQEGHILLKSLLFSVDPYLRGRMSG